VHCQESFNNTYVIVGLLKNMWEVTIPQYVKSSPVTGLGWPRGFQEVKVPRFHDNGTGWW
jgi:hypothetical protein